jgi:type IV pilus assembly protein PilC
MPSYHVLFTDPAGQSSETALSAPSLPALARRLQQQGYTLSRVSPPRPSPSLKGYWRRVSEAEVNTLLRQLATTLDNGVSLADALALLARETHNLTMRAVLLDLEHAIRDGDSLSCALSAYPRIFSPIYVRLLEAGEAGNSLPEVLRHLAEYADRAGQASQRIRTSLVYPQVVGVFTLAVITFAFLSVVPKFLDLFRELGVKEFPLVTQALFWLSATGIPALVILFPFAALGGWLAYARMDRRAPFVLAQLRTRIPVLGTLYHNFSLLRLTRLLAALLHGGVPLLDALRLAGQGAESPLLQAAMWDAIPHVAGGESLATAFGHAGILPPTFCGQIAAAEAGGDLPGALVRLANWYAERVDYLAARAGALLEPLLIFVLAIMAGWVALGVFAPLVSVIQSLSGGGQ